MCEFWELDGEVFGKCTAPKGYKCRGRSRPDGSNLSEIGRYLISHRLKTFQPKDATAIRCMADVRIVRYVIVGENTPIPEGAKGYKAYRPTLVDGKVPYDERANMRYENLVILPEAGSDQAEKELDLEDAVFHKIVVGNVSERVASKAFAWIDSDGRVWYAFHSSGSGRHCGNKKAHSPHIVGGYDTVRYGGLDYYCSGMATPELDIRFTFKRHGGPETPGVQRGIWSKVPKKEDERP